MCGNSQWKFTDLWRKQEKAQLQLYASYWQWSVPSMHGRQAIVGSITAKLDLVELQYNNQFRFRLRNVYNNLSTLDEKINSRLIILALSRKQAKTFKSPSYRSLVEVEKYYVLLLNVLLKSAIFSVFLLYFVEQCKLICMQNRKTKRPF